MPSISNPQQSEREWAESLEREYRLYRSRVISATNRAWTPYEIQSNIDYTERVLQFLSSVRSHGERVDAARAAAATAAAGLRAA